MPEKTATEKDYYSNLHSFINYASSFFDGENRSQRIENSEEFQKVNNQIRFFLISLGLLNIEDIDSLNFKELIELLGKYLSSSEKDPGASIPPNLKELVEIYNQRENQEADKEIERSLDELRKIARIKKALASQGTALSELKGKEEELVNLLIKKEDLVSEIEVVEESSQLTSNQKEEKIQETWNKVWNDVLEESHLSPSQKKEAQNLVFPAEAIKELASEIKEISTEPASEEKVKEILSENFSKEDFSLQSPVKGKEEEIAQNLKLNEETSLLIDKIRNNPQLSEDQKTEQIEETWKETWEQAVEGANFTKEEASLAQKHVFSVDTIESISTELSKPERDNEKITAIIKESFRPLSQEQIKLVNESLIPNVAANAALAPSLEWKNVVLISFAQNAPELETKGFNPNQILSLNKKISWIAERNFPRNTIREDISLLNPPLVVWNKSSSPLINLAPVKDNPQGNPFLVKDEEGRTIFNKARGIFERKLTPEIAQKLKTEADEIVAFNWTVKGVNPETINLIVKNEQNRKQTLDSPLLRQLNDYSNKLRLVQDRLPPNLVSLWKENRNKTISVAINKIAPSEKLNNKIRNWFFNTGVGKSIKTAIGSSAQKSLQGLFSSLKVGVKKAVTAATSKVLIKLGLHALANTIAPVIGTVVAFVAEKLIKGSLKLVRKGVAFITSGFGLTQSIFGGLSSQEFNDKDGDDLKKLLILTFTVVIALCLISILGITGGAFVGEFNIANEYTEQARTGSSRRAEYQCESPRHLGEEVICKLSKETPPCNNKIISMGTWVYVNSCFDKITFTEGDKEAVKNKFRDHVVRYTYLQCVGFVRAILSGLGKDIDSRDPASKYTQAPYPPGYTKIDGNDNPQPGDIAVWSGSGSGHIAVVIGTSGNIKIIVAEADGKEYGAIAIKEWSRPSIFLRYTGQ